MSVRVTRGFIRLTYLLTTLHRGSQNVVWRGSKIEGFEWKGVRRGGEVSLSPVD